MLDIDWKKYWKDFVTFEVKDDYFELNKISNLFPSGKKEFIEIGGFPGTFSVYFSKFKHYKVTLLDTYLDKKVVSNMLRRNGLNINAISTIKTNIEQYKSKKKYDVVFSAGVIEHFSNIEKIIDKHYSLLEKNGALFISVPNFLGINGLVQKMFDKKNYYAHNLESMDVKKLRKILEKYNFKEVEIFYLGSPCIWLEKNAPVSPGVRRFISILSTYLSKLYIKNWVFSPHLAIYGINN